MANRWMPKNGWSQCIWIGPFESCWKGQAIGIPSIYHGVLIRWAGNKPGKKGRENVLVQLHHMYRRKISPFHLLRVKLCLKFSNSFGIYFHKGAPRRVFKCNHPPTKKKKNLGEMSIKTKMFNQWNIPFGGFIWCVITSLVNLSSDFFVPWR